MGVGVLRNRLRALEKKLGEAQRMAAFVDQFEAEARAGVEAGRYCPVDMPVIVDCFRRWLRDGITFKVPRGR
ncbi:MAG: hypothetical protein HQ465_16660 [Rhodospirillales bacterium]|nr:hypothetical protein [Rhodospirillales bacterium]